ncbi:lipopolysaccharide transport periplasmic protein LptA [Ostreibacterium oceani]|uniref:Lipopolysaccharide transport periplasmic protein LptA n=1 Tax=Ostreibacterium oceani TaxID=2654998 RepID=A0A6N7EWR8_9GAMM|nr:lipopolysaccharide transport periplasmic protein LptA [Ostreibacterium oceani]MPV86363.1 lipopolysaccharide transport periplasmic protein LptA [Ostreibacterium oceani]
MKRIRLSCFTSCFTMMLLMITSLQSQVVAAEPDKAPTQENTSADNTSADNASSDSTSSDSTSSDSTSSDSTSLPIDLTADKGSYDQLAGVAIYEGNVKVTQGVSTIWADKLTIYLTNNAVERMVATGQPAKFEYLGQQQPILGQGNTVEYTILDKIVTLTDNAQVEQGSDVIRGATLTYDLSQEIIGGSRVEMTFQPRTQ